MSDIHNVTCTICKGTKLAPCYSCAGQGIIYVRQDRPPTHVELEMTVRYQRERLAELAADHEREIALLSVTDREKELLEQNRALETRTRQLRRELTKARDNNYTRNLELDALHYVWCDGGCSGGVHRYDGQGDKALSEELVRAGEQSIARLRSWWENHKYRTTRERMGTP